MSQVQEQREDLILAPLRSVLIEQHQEFDDFCQVACVAISEMEGLPDLTQALCEPAADVERANTIAAIAEREHASGFATLFHFATVFTWGALETAIRDIVVNWLFHVPESRQHEKIRRLRIPFSEYEALDPKDRIRYLVGLLENDLGANLKPGVGRFESLLNEVGLGGSVGEDLRRDLLEMGAVRNVLVHRLGVIDDRFVGLCPWYGVSVGERVSVTRDVYYGKYRKAVFQYAASVARRVRGQLRPAPDQNQ